MANQRRNTRLALATRQVRGDINHTVVFDGMPLNRKTRRLMASHERREGAPVSVAVPSIGKRWGAL